MTKAGRRKRLAVVIPIIVVVGFILILFTPSPAAEFAVRKDLFVSLHPIQAFGASVTQGREDPQYGSLYEVSNVEAAFVYVKKGGYGWYVASRGTTP